MRSLFDDEGSEKERERRGTENGHDRSRRTFLRACCVAAGMFALPGSARAAPFGSSPSGRHVVGTRSADARVAARASASSVYRELDFGSIGGAVVGRFPTQALEGLARRPDVRYIEPDGVVEAIDLGLASEAVASTTASTQTLPWGVDRIDAEIAHAAGRRGRYADVAIIDSGLDRNHPDLKSNLGAGVSFVSYTTSWHDDNGHGTHCGGTAAARDNTIGVVGVAPRATLHAVKVLDGSNKGVRSDFAAGIRWVAQQGYHVASMSMGSSTFSQLIKDACAYAYGRGVLLVAAAGNNSGAVLYPAAYPEVVAVSAIDSRDRLASFSSRGPEIELAAPGVSIRSTTLGGGYGTKSGTSMACPHVAGTAALLMARGRSNTSTRSRLRSTAENVGLAREHQGHGLVDAAAANGLAS